MTLPRARARRHWEAQAAAAGRPRPHSRNSATPAQTLVVCSLLLFYSHFQATPALPLLITAGFSHHHKPTSPLLLLSALLQRTLYIYTTSGLSDHSGKAVFFTTYQRVDRTPRIKSLWSIYIKDPNSQTLSSLLLNSYHQGRPRV